MAVRSSRRDGADFFMRHLPVKRAPARQEMGPGKFLEIMFLDMKKLKVEGECGYVTPDSLT